jgi:type IV secretory pathway VirB2 component (pilin)
VGLFPAGAPLVSDVAAVVEVGMAVLLVVGAFVVRAGHVRLHQALQSSVILVNIPIVLYAMVPSYLTFVAPFVPGALGTPRILVPTLMLVAGGAAEALGVYIILVAGTNWIPARLRFRRYKLWMRTELILWWLVVLAGLTTYWLFYVPGASL